MGLYVIIFICAAFQSKIFSPLILIKITYIVKSLKWQISTCPYDNLTVGEFGKDFRISINFYCWCWPQSQHNLTTFVIFQTGKQFLHTFRALSLTVHMLSLEPKSWMNRTNNNKGERRDGTHFRKLDNWTLKYSVMHI